MLRSILRAAPPLLAAVVPSFPVGGQDELSRAEVEERVTAHLALDPHDASARSAALVLLQELADVPFPAQRELKRWDKLFARALEARLDQRPLARKPGEHTETVGARTGRYFLGGELKKPRGLFLGLHGGGAGAGDAGSAHASWTEACDELGWLGLFPEVLEKTERGWTDSGTEEWVLGLLERAVHAFEIDPDQVVIGGHSMGGYGTWVLGAHHADRFAAGVASAGAPTPVFQGGRIVAIQTGVIPNLRNLPLLVYQSTDDPQVPPDANQAAVREVERARERFGGYERFEYWEVSDRGHGFPEGGPGALLGKIAGFARDPLPREVVWQPALAWKRQFYWLHWETPKEGATVIARLDEQENAVEVDLRRTDGAGLSVLLNETMLDLERPVIVRVNGRRVHAGPVVRSFATLVETAALGDPGRRFVARIPLHRP